MKKDYKNLSEIEKLEHAHFLYMGIIKEVYDTALNNENLDKLINKVDAIADSNTRQRLRRDIGFYKVITKHLHEIADKEVDRFLGRLKSL